MAQSSDFEQRFQTLGAAMTLRDLQAQIDTIKENHPEAEALASLMQTNGHGVMTDSVREFLNGAAQLPQPARKRGPYKTKSTSKTALRERYAAIKRPAEKDLAFPRMRGPLTANNLSRFEERVAAYWAER